MAMLEFTARSGEVAFSAGVAKTALQALAGTNTPIKVKRIIGSFKGTSNLDTPANIQIVQQTGAGSGGTAVTLVKLNPSDAETLQSSAIQGLTAEPASDDYVLHEFKCHTQEGFELKATEFNKPVVNLRGGKRLGVKVLCVNAVTGCFEIEAEE